MIRIIFTSLIILVAVAWAFGQDRLQSGLMPHLNVNYKIQESWRLNFKYETRQLFRERDALGNENKAFRYVLSDFSFLLLRKTGLSNQLGAGYLVRIRDGNWIHRTTQQFSVLRNYRTFRLSHRFVGDQTFEPDAPAEWRLRYRIGLDVALQGESVDRGEFYFKLTNEYLNILAGGTYDLEIRIMPVIGYVIQDHSKFELRLDARYDSFIGMNARQSYWFRVGWFYSI